MRLHRLVALLNFLGVIQFAAGQTPGAFAGDYRQLEGCWVVFRCEQDGATIPERNGRMFIFEGKTVHLDTDLGRENYVVHEDRSPKTIDFLDGRNLPVLGIYKFEDDTLVTCTADPGVERPKTFHTTPGDRTLLTHMRRGK
jgi:uncharacterized protein (TIGR03067 family)